MKHTGNDKATTLEDMKTGDWKTTGHQRPTHHCAPLWHADCLGAVAVLGLGFNKKQQQRLAAKFHLAGGGEGDPDPVRIFLELHEACHSHEPLVREINKELRKRFGETVKRVRNSSPEEMTEHRTDLPLPFIWAALSDSREEVRLEGRRRLHGLLLRMLASHSREEQKEKDTRETLERLMEENQRLHKAAEALQAEVQRLRTAPREPAVSSPREASMGGNRGVGFSSQSVCRRQQREMRKLAHALHQEQEKTAALEEQLRRVSQEKASCGNAGLPCKDPGETLREENGCCARSCAAAESPTPKRGTLVCRGVGEFMGAGDRPDCCPLQRMKIAILGGTEKTLPEYRCMVQELGGECLYHDGCTGNGVDRLRRILGRADVVVCITSINSHGAMKMAKSFCKRKGKRFLVTRETGTCSLREMLLQLAV